MKKINGYSTQTFNLMRKWAQSTDRILDIGCGNAATTYFLEQNGYDSIYNLDIKDFREFKTSRFQIWNGIEIPIEDCFFDLVSLNFVLHHLSNDQKTVILNEAKRVTKGFIFILEDTPKNAFDNILSYFHGWHYQHKMKSKSGFGFYSQTKWEEIFNSLGLRIAISQKLGRFSRRLGQPYKRAFFLLTVKNGK
ncbi:MAG: class I SAM-dependent methyltransferase [Candidatus Heimdallarchaeota archaeon]